MKKSHKCWKCFLYIILSISVFSGVSALLFILIFGNITIEMADGNVNSYSMDVENSKVTFADSDIFNYILMDQMTEITKMVVIKNQLETNGEYDPDKLIDIVEYSNRYGGYTLTMDPVYYRLEDLLKWQKIGFSLQINETDSTIYNDEGQALDGTDSTAELADITGSGALNDQQVSGTTDTVTATTDTATEAIDNETGATEYAQTDGTTGNEDTDSKLADTTTESKLGSVYDNTISQVEVQSEDELSEMELEIILSEDGNEGNWIEAYDYALLNEEFLPADGNTLISHASNIAQYLKLKSFLKDAATDLYINYVDYSALKDYYNMAESNVRYCYCINNNGNEIFYTNVGSEIKTLSASDVTDYFKKYDKYIYYNPGTLEYETNTQLDDMYIESYLEGYEYTFGNDSCVWIGVDLSKDSTVQDVYTNAQDAYNKLYPNWIYYVTIIVISAIALLGTGVGLTIYEWKNIPQKTDRIPLELELLIIASLVSCAYFILELWYYNVELVNLKSGYSWLIIGGVAVIIACGSAGVYSTFVRRLKARVLIKNSITYWLAIKICRICMAVINGIIKIAKSTYFLFYDNGKIFTRVLLPFSLCLIVNIVLFATGTVVGVALALIADCGICAFIYWENIQRQKIVDSIRKIREGDFNYKLDTKKMHGSNLVLAEAVNEIGTGIKTAVETSMKDERLKADLITNVSHDIKTPLTSIINYVDLIKREEIDNEKIKGYIEVLDAKSQRLKQLTDDLVEASKISSGNIVLEMEKINFVELINQTIGEFQQKLEQKKLKVVVNLPAEPVYIEADSRRMWRVIENLFNNVCKYALENTRVYIDMRMSYPNENQGLEEMLNSSKVELSVKNISANQLNIGAEDLTERFIRGDVSRSTEGSGLGLSIAKNLTIAQNGKFDIYLDGDLFKATISFPIYKKRMGQSN